jgi:2-oxo-3-hexenedioate decarboxylase
VNAADLARTFLAARANREEIAELPSSHDAAFDMDAAYAVQAELTRLRVESGHKIAGRKVGYANKALWRMLKLETLVWANMYDDTVHQPQAGPVELPASAFRSPRIEPEIVFRLKQPIASSGLDAAAALAAVEWMALGFEIIDCPFADWTFQPVDFVAAGGLHAALVVGEPLKIESERIPELVNQLASFKLQLSESDQAMEEGSGKNSLRSPALCLAELAGAALRRGDPLGAGELISTGTLTNALGIDSGDEWRADAEGLPVASLELRLS